MEIRSKMLTTLTAALLVAAVVPVASAQPPGGGPRGMHGSGHDGRDGRDGGTALFEFLGLSDEQRQAWTDAHRAHFEALKPSFEKMRELREQLEAELGESSPDAATVGGYVISLHQLESELKASRGDLDAAIKEILTPEQETKLEAFKAANGDGRHGFGFGGPDGGGQHHGRPGFGGPPGGAPDHDPNA